MQHAWTNLFLIFRILSPLLSGRSSKFTFPVKIKGAGGGPNYDDIFKLGASAAAREFLSGFRFELMYISLIENVRSNLTHLHGFQLFVLLL